MSEQPSNGDLRNPKKENIFKKAARKAGQDLERGAQLHQEEEHERSVELTKINAALVALLRHYIDQGQDEIDLVELKKNFADDRLSTKVGGLLDHMANQGEIDFWEPGKTGHRKIDLTKAEKWLTEPMQNGETRENLRLGLVAAGIEVGGDSIAGGKQDKDGSPFNEDSALVTELSLGAEAFDLSSIEAGLSNFTLLEVADGISTAQKSTEVSGVAVNLAKVKIAQKLSALIEDLHIPTDDEIQSILASSIEEVHQEIAKAAKEEELKLGTTLTLALVDRRTNKTYFGHIGDSKAYVVTKRRLRKPQIEQLTKDHTLGERLRDIGQEPGRQADSILVQSIGSTNKQGQPVELDIQTGVVQLGSNQKLLLCSDGLLTLEESEIAKIAAQNESPTEIGQQLLQRADQAGEEIDGEGKYDNITALITETHEASEKRTGKRQGFLGKISQAFSAEGKLSLKGLTDWAKGLVPAFKKGYREGAATEILAKGSEAINAQGLAESLRGTIREEGETTKEHFKRLFEGGIENILKLLEKLNPAEVIKKIEQQIAEAVKPNSIDTPEDTLDHFVELADADMLNSKQLVILFLRGRLEEATDFGIGHYREQIKSIGLSLPMLRIYKLYLNAKDRFLNEEGQIFQMPEWLKDFVNRGDKTDSDEDSFKPGVIVKNEGEFPLARIISEEPSLKDRIAELNQKRQDLETDKQRYAQLLSDRRPRVLTAGEHEEGSPEAGTDLANLERSIVLREQELAKEERNFMFRALIEYIASQLEPGEVVNRDRLREILKTDDTYVDLVLRAMNDFDLVDEQGRLVDDFREKIAKLDFNGWWEQQLANKFAGEMKRLPEEERKALTVDESEETDEGQKKLEQIDKPIQLRRMLEIAEQDLTQAEQSYELAVINSDEPAKREAKERMEALKEWIDKIKQRLKELTEEGKNWFEKLKEKKLFKSIGRKAKEIWDSIPKNKEELREWNEQRKERKEARWEAKKKAYDVKRERWEQKFDIEDVSEHDLNEWELALEKGETLEAGQIVALVLNQRVGTSKKLLKPAHRRALKAEGIHPDKDLIDWLRFQWEKELTDDVYDAEKGSEKVASRLKLWNLKIYDRIRHAAIAEAGVDRFGRPNATGIAKEDANGWWDKNVGRYWKMMFKEANLTKAERNVGYYVTYFPTLAGLMLAPGVTAMTKRIASAGIGMLGFSGELLKERIEAEYEGDAEKFWKEFEERNSQGWGKIKVLGAKLAASSAVEQIALGLKGAGMANLIQDVLNIEGLHEAMVDKLNDHIRIDEEGIVIDFDGIQEDMSVEERDALIEELKEQGEAFEEAAEKAEAEAEELQREIEAIEERLERAQEGAGEPSEVPTDLGGDIIPEAELGIQDFQDQLESTTVNRNVWDIFDQQAEQFAQERPHNDSNSVAGTMTRLWRQLNPGVAPEAIGPNTEIKFLNEPAREKMMEAILDAHDEFRKVGGDVSQLSEVERLLVGGETGEFRTFTDEQATMVLNEVLNN